MPTKSYENVRKSIIAKFERVYPTEKVYSTVFAEYILDEYCRLLTRMFRKLEEKELDNKNKK